MTRASWVTPVIRIAVLALALRLLLLFLRGDYIVFDEGYYLLLARSLREGHGFRLNGLPHVALSPLQPAIVAALSFVMPDLWASRLLAAVCGAALLFPVASLANRWYGARGAILAASVTAVAPPLLTFLPFFPGHGWNLYFGSEPLFLLLAVGAVAVAASALDGRPWKFFAAGALADLSYCTRLEGVVLGASLGVALVVWLARRNRALLARGVLLYASGAVVAVPYLLYLHSALGRWALSGRVQAAAVAAAAAPASVATPAGGSGAVESFVWGGDVEALWRTLYALDGSKTQMSSQYWGVPSRPVVAAAPDTTQPRRPAGPAPSKIGMLFSAAAKVLPITLFVLAIAGVLLLRARFDAALWIGPMLVTGIAPAVLAYAEPRAMLMLVPAACLLAGGALTAMARLAEERMKTASPILAIVLLLLLLPTMLDASRAWSQGTDLQRVATARRIVGEYLAGHLPAASRLVSWHPAIAIWARRDWRVLPYAPFEDIVRYAQAQRAGTVVFSRFDPSPLREPPRAFTAILVDSGVSVTGSNIHLEPVESTQQLFVGRLAP